MTTRKPSRFKKIYLTLIVVYLFFTEHLGLVIALNVFFFWVIFVYKLIITIYN